MDAPVGDGGFWGVAHVCSRVVGMRGMFPRAGGRGQRLVCTGGLLQRGGGRGGAGFGLMMVLCFRQGAFFMAADLVAGVPFAGNVDPRVQARVLFWQGWRISDIARLLGLKPSVVLFVEGAGRLGGRGAFAAGGGECGAAAAFFD